MADLEARGVTKHFGGVVALEDVDFDAARGEVHALIGENGAGKSTFIKVLTGAVRPDAGELRLFGAPLAPDVSLIFAPLAVPCSSLVSPAASRRAAPCRVA